MAALAYVLLPVSGLLAYSLGSTPRLRFHGLQAVVLGFIWPLALYAGSFVSPVLTQLVFATGIAIWLWLFVATLSGRDPGLPVVGDTLRRAAEAD